MWYKSNFFKYAAAIIMILVIILLLGQIDYFLNPFKKLVAVLFFPFFISGLFYYLLRPLVRLAGKIKLPSTLAIIIIFIIMLFCIAVLGTYAGTLIVKQFNQLINDLPQIAQTAREKITVLFSNSNLGSFYTGNLEEQVTSYLQKIIPIIGSSILGVISAVTGIASVLIAVPFMLFYLLKDDRRFVTGFSNIIPEKYKSEFMEVLKDTDNTLSVYITGQAIIATILGILMYTGYMIIGLNYSFILALFALITSFIPMFGSVIGVVPAFFVGLADNPLMALKVLIIVVIVQQIEGNLISPNLIGKRLDIHPLTIILIFLGAASLYGFIGMLVAVPAYAIIKVIISGARKMYRIWKYEKSRG